jgi:cytidine deaminase
MTEVMMNLDQALIDAATDLLVSYFPGNQGIAAAAYTDSGALYTSVVFDPEWGGAGLCAETGAILEAVKRKERVTAIACVGRLGGDEPIVLLTPCGICQERLIHFGADVQIAVPHRDDPTRWQMKLLREVQPHYWVNGYRQLYPELK